MIDVAARWARRYCYCHWDVVSLVNMRNRNVQVLHMKRSIGISTTEFPSMDDSELGAQKVDLYPQLGVTEPFLVHASLVATRRT